MEYSKNAWIHTDFTPATCAKCGRFVFVLNTSQTPASECFACLRESVPPAAVTAAPPAGRREADLKRVVPTSCASPANTGADKIAGEASDKRARSDPSGGDNRSAAVVTEPRRPRLKTRRTPTNGDDYDSETSSVHSNSSSRRKTSRKGRRRCPVHGHGKTRKDDDTGEHYREVERREEEEEEEEDGRPAPPDCTCRRRARSKPSSRPEPEGSHAHARYMDENDAVIYSNEPLFSDDDDDNDVTTAQVREDADRHHRRVDCKADNLFSAAQMVNTNTMLKFAIIQAELKNMELSLRKVIARITDHMNRS